MRNNTASGTTVLRQLNTRLVLAAVRDASPNALRLAEIARETGLTRPTVTEVVEDLVGEEWLIYHEPSSERRSVGRPAARISLNGLAAPVLGLDIGAHSVTVAVSDLSARRLALTRRPHTPRDAADVLQSIRLSIHEAIAEAGLTIGDVASVTAGSPGLVDYQHGTISLASAVPGVTAIPVADHLLGMFNCPVHLENDANLSALAIAAARNRPAETLIAVQWGERIGAGVVIAGRLHRGGSGAAGELRFITPPGKRGPAGADRQGWHEEAIGAGGIARRAHAAAAEHPQSPLARSLRETHRSGYVAALFAAATEGDPVATTVVEEVATVFASAIAPAVLMLDPDAIVIGGGVARAGEVLACAIRRQLHTRTLTTPAVELSPLAQDAVITGAIQVALEDVWQRIMANSANPFPHLPASTIGAGAGREE